MSLRLFAAAIVATLFLMAGLALGRPPDVIRGIAEPPQSDQETDQGQTTGPASAERRPGAAATQ